jgi:transcriptional regulator with XRE-family HTH domain
MLGKKLAELRKKKGLTQEKLAELAGVHWTYIAKMEAGDRFPSSRLLLKLADIFDKKRCPASPSPLGERVRGLFVVYICVIIV